MNITKTSQKVYDLFNKFDELNDEERLEVNIIIFEEWSRDLINSKNTTDVSKYDDEEINIFNPTILGLQNNIGSLCSKIFLMVLNNSLKENKKPIAEIENLDPLSLKLSNNSSKWISIYEKLSFIEKIDTLTEIIIRYYNETLFEMEKGLPKIDSSINEYNIAEIIKKYKESIGYKNDDDFPYEIV